MSIWVVGGASYVGPVTGIRMAGSSIVDARNILDDGALRELAFTCVGIGRP